MYATDMCEIESRNDVLIYHDNNINSSNIVTIYT